LTAYGAEVYELYAYQFVVVVVVVVVVVCVCIRHLSTVSYIDGSKMAIYGSVSLHL